MKNWILLIGLLTYSSVGWSETLVMECFRKIPEILVPQLGEKESSGIFKMETDKGSSSSKLLTRRIDGEWMNLCEGINSCRKGDDSVIITNSYGSSVLDFKLLLKKVKGKVDRCEKIK